MATRTLGVSRSYNAVPIRQDRKMSNREAAQASVVMPAASSSPERRCGARVEYRCMCSYQVLDVFNEGLVVVQQGEAFVLNRSRDGILLLLGQPIREEQLIRVDIACSGRDRIGSVFEPRWTKPIHVESLGNLYLVGCRRISPPPNMCGSNIPPIKPRLKTNSFS
jgi:hypothetical protein